MCMLERIIEKQKKKKRKLLLTELESKVDQDRRQDKQTQHCRPKSVIIGTGQSLPDPVRAPVEGGQGVHHHDHRDKHEHARRDASDTVAKVQETDRQGAEKDGEVEPGQEGALVGEKDLGLDTHGQGDALAGGGLEQRLGRGGHGHGGCVDVSGHVV